LATKIASDWVFLKTGKVDTLLFIMHLDNMLKIIVGGVLFIIAVTVWTAKWRTRRKTATDKSISASGAA